MLQYLTHKLRTQSINEDSSSAGSSAVPTTSAAAAAQRHHNQQHQQQRQQPLLLPQRYHPQLGGRHGPLPRAQHAHEKVSHSSRRTHILCSRASAAADTLWPFAAPALSRTLLHSVKPAPPTRRRGASERTAVMYVQCCVPIHTYLHAGDGDGRPPSRRSRVRAYTHSHTLDIASRPNGVCADGGSVGENPEQFVSRKCIILDR